MPLPRSAWRWFSTPRFHDGGFVEIETDESALRIGLGHQHRGETHAAAHIGHVGSLRELRDDAIEGWQPGRHEVRSIARAEEAFAAVVDVRVVLMPADAGAGAGGFGDPGRVDDRAERD